MPDNHTPPPDPAEHTTQQLGNHLQLIGTHTNIAVRLASDLLAILRARRSDG